MSKLSVFLFILLISSCSTNDTFVDPIRPEFEIISFEVVQKELEIKTILPSHTKTSLSQWFDQKVKIDGFDGEMKFTIYEYSEETSSISEGKRIDISLSYNVYINKPSLSQNSLIEGSVSSYGTLTGNYSLSEFDTVIRNTQSDLILRLTRDLKSKI